MILKSWASSRGPNTTHPQTLGWKGWLASHRNEMLSTWLEIACCVSNWLKKKTQFIKFQLPRKRNASKRDIIYRGRPALQTGIPPNKLCDNDAWKNLQLCVWSMLWGLKNLHERPDKAFHRTLDTPWTRLLARPLLEIMSVPKLLQICSPWGGFILGKKKYKYLQQPSVIFFGVSKPPAYLFFYVLKKEKKKSSCKNWPRDTAQLMDIFEILQGAALAKFLQLQETTVYVLLWIMINWFCSGVLEKFPVPA